MIALIDVLAQAYVQLKGKHAEEAYQKLWDTQNQAVATPSSSSSDDKPAPLESKILDGSIDTSLGLLTIALERGLWSSQQMVVTTKMLRCMMQGKKMPADPQQIANAAFQVITKALKAHVSKLTTEEGRKTSVPVPLKSLPAPSPPAPSSSTRPSPPQKPKKQFTDRPHHSYRGVARDKNRYQATLYFKAKRFHLGSFPTPELAAQAYDREVTFRKTFFHVFETDYSQAIKYGKPLNFPQSSSPSTPHTSHPPHPKPPRVKTATSEGDSPPSLKRSPAPTTTIKREEEGRAQLCEDEIEVWREDITSSIAQKFHCIATSLDTLISHVPYESDGSTELQSFIEGSMAKRGRSTVQNPELAVMVCHQWIVLSRFSLQQYGVMGQEVQLVDPPDVVDLAMLKRCVVNPLACQDMRGSVEVRTIRDPTSPLNHQVLLAFIEANPI